MKINKNILWIIAVWIIAIAIVVTVLLFNEVKDKGDYTMDITREFIHESNPDWTEKSGKWEIDKDIIKGTSGAIYRNEQAANFTYKANITPIDGIGELIFRTNNDPTQNGYAVSLSKNGDVILKQQPNRVMGEAKVSGGTHTVKVVTDCENIYVYIDDDLKLKAVSNSFPSGRYALAAVEGSVEFSDISGYIGPRLSVEKVAKSVKSLPVQKADSLSLTLPDLGGEYVVNVYSTDYSTVVDKSGNIVPPIKEQRVKVILNIIDRLDYSQALTSEIEVTIPARTINPDIVLDVTDKQNAIAELKKMKFEDGNARYKELKRVADSITRYHYPQDLRDEYDKIAGIIYNLIERIRLKELGEGLYNKTNNFDAFNKSAVEIAADVRLRMIHLYQDKFPQEDWFSHPGGHVVDNSIVYDETSGMYHFYYNYGTGGYSGWEVLENKIGHAVSADLINWKNLQPVVYTSLDGFDCYMNWCPQVLKMGDWYYMFYTGVNENVSQATALARSKDLYNWEKLYGDQIHYPGEWDSGYSKESWSNERDPMVFFDGDKAYLYYCASADGVGNVIGVASMNMSEYKDWNCWTKWTDEGYMVTPTGSNRACESPYVLKQHGKYYLFYSPAGMGTTVAVSDSPLGPWKGIKELTPGRNASEIMLDAVNNRYIISEITKDAFDIQFSAFQELIITEDGDVSVKDIEMPDVTFSAQGSKISNGYKIQLSFSLAIWEYSSNHMLDRYSESILINGISLKEISNNNDVTVSYNAQIRALEIYISDCGIVKNGENNVKVLADLPLLVEGHCIDNEQICIFKIN